MVMDAKPGGSDDRPSPMRRVECFFDEGPGDYRCPKPFRKMTLPRLHCGRAAAAVARDQLERLCVMGGKVVVIPSW